MSDALLNSTPGRPLIVSMFCDPVFQLDVERAEKSLNYEMNERLKFIAISRHDEKTLTSTPLTCTAA